MASPIVLPERVNISIDNASTHYLSGVYPLGYLEDISKYQEFGILNSRILIPLNERNKKRYDLEEEINSWPIHEISFDAKHPQTAHVMYQFQEHLKRDDSLIGNVIDILPFSSLRKEQEEGFSNHKSRFKAIGYHSLDDNNSIKVEFGLSPLNQLYLISQAVYFQHPQEKEVMTYLQKIKE